jgi:HSP20 family protein
MKLPSWKSRPESGMSFPRLRDRWERLFENLLSDPFRDLGFGNAGLWAPDIDVKDRENEIEVRAELPGMEPNDIQLNVQGNVLSISGEKREERDDKGGDYTFTEISYGSFQRAVALPEGADPDKVDAQYDKGVLRIRIQKKAGSAPKRIAVKPGEAKAPAKKTHDDLDEPGSPS